jgi:hypothetical protein
MIKILLAAAVALSATAAHANTEICAKAQDFNGCMAYFAKESTKVKTSPIVEEMIPYVTKGFYDPSSAEFSELTLYEFESGHQLITGKVNGKNRYGGYVGAVSFVYTVKGLGKNPMRTGLFKSVSLPLTQNNGVLMDQVTASQYEFSINFANHYVILLADWSKGGESWLVSDTKEKNLPKFKEHYMTAYGTLKGPTATKINR